MKKFCIALLALVSTFAVHAADKALLDEEDTWQLYTKLNYKYSQIGGDTAQYGGIEVGRLLNEDLGFSLGAYALLHDVENDNDEENNDTIEAFSSWYGGLTVERFFSSSELFHPSLYLFAGGGILQFKDPVLREEQEEAAYALIEPGANFMVNINQTIEFGLGLGYRVAIGTDRTGFSDDDVNSYTINAFFRFTQF